MAAENGGLDVRAVGERVERLIAELRDGGDPRAAYAAEELVGSIVELYGTALAHTVELVGGAALIADPLVEALLLVHDLHPFDVDTRIQRALDGVRPYLGSHAGGVEFLGIDEQGVVRLRLEGTCNGCPSSTATVRSAIEQAIEEAAPETTGVEVEGVVAEPVPGDRPKLLQITRLAPDQGMVAVAGMAPPAGTVVPPGPCPVPEAAGAR